MDINLFKIENVNIFLDLKLHDIPNTIKNMVLKQLLILIRILQQYIFLADDKMQQMASLSKKNVKILGVQF